MKKKASVFIISIYTYMCILRNRRYMCVLYLLLYFGISLFFDYKKGMRVWLFFFQIHVY